MLDDPRRGDGNAVYNEGLYHKAFQERKQAAIGNVSIGTDAPGSSDVRGDAI